MAIQVRRGNYADFDPSKMVAGEFAVCLDNGYVYITLSPGNSIRLGTAETIEEALEMAEAYMKDAEAWAKGTRGGVPVSSTDPAYHNNSKYYSEQASSAETNGLISEGYAVGNQHGTPVGSSSPYYHNNSKYYCEKAEEYKDEAEAIVGIGIATTTTAGIVKPDGTTITVDNDGTIHGNDTSVIPEYYIELGTLPTYYQRETEPLILPDGALSSPFKLILKNLGSRVWVCGQNGHLYVKETSSSTVYDIGVYFKGVNEDVQKEFYVRVDSYKTLLFDVSDVNNKKFRTEDYLGTVSGKDALLTDNTASNVELYRKSIRIHKDEAKVVFVKIENPSTGEIEEQHCYMCSVGDNDSIPDPVTIKIDSENETLITRSYSKPFGADYWSYIFLTSSSHTLNIFSYNLNHYY